mmetsp:Transcript_3135/g.6911  ORF Transcript_3135/g.6911 Transcript_3135/m.6911 type:complete len:82 (+) Transcript_3135:574-819(+)
MSYYWQAYCAPMVGTLVEVRHAEHRRTSCVVDHNMHVENAGLVAAHAEVAVAIRLEAEEENKVVESNLSPPSIDWHNNTVP